MAHARPEGPAILNRRMKRALVGFRASDWCSESLSVKSVLVPHRALTHGAVLFDDSPNLAPVSELAPPAQISKSGRSFDHIRRRAGLLKTSRGSVTRSWTQARPGLETGEAGKGLGKRMSWISSPYLISPCYNLLFI